MNSALISYICHIFDRSAGLSALPFSPIEHMFNLVILLKKIIQWHVFT